MTFNARKANKAVKHKSRNWHKKHKLITFPDSSRFVNITILFTLFCQIILQWSGIVICVGPVKYYNVIQSNKHKECNPIFLANTILYIYIYIRYHVLVRDWKIFRNSITVLGPSWLLSYGSFFGFTANYPISAYLHWRCELESHSGKAYSIQHYMIKCVSDLRRTMIFSGTSVSSTNKTDRQHSA